MYIATLFVLILLYFAHFGSTEQTACPCENKSWCQPIEKVPEREVSECRGSTTGSGEFGPFTIRPSGIFGEFGLLVGEFGPQLENSAN